MGVEELPIIAVLGALLVASGLASGTETALFRLSESERRIVRERRPVGGAALDRLLDAPRALLITILLLNMSVNILYFVFSSVLAMRSEHAALQAGISVASVLLLILLGEVLPKLLAGAHRLTYAAVVAGPLLVVSRALSPIRIFVDWFMVTPVTRLVGAGELAAPVSHDDLRRLVESGVDHGAISEEERRLLSEAIRLGRRKASEAMTPRTRIPWISRQQKRGEVLRVVRRTERTRLPVRADDDHPAGFLDVKSFLIGSEAMGNDAAISPEYVAPAKFVPETVSMDRLLDFFRESGEHVAFCVDEHGSITGMIQIEDIARAMSVPPPGEGGGLLSRVMLIGLETWLAPALTPVRDLAETDSVFADLADAFGERVQTLGGVLQAALGRMPEEGDRVTVGRVELEVDRVKGRAVDSVVLRVLDEPEEEQREPL
ncbi:MAG: DUF21 domain-containing protein [Phycisphaerales bacterium]|nr:DUF21 domain-containing protein [Phycisphaerales bacterium]